MTICSKRRSFFCCQIVAASLFVLLPLAQAAAQQAGSQVRRTGVVQEDVYLAGGQVNLNAQLTGDAVLAGGNLFIGGTVTGDVLAAGGQISLDALVSDDVRAVGGEIAVHEAVRGDAVLAGGSVKIMRNAAVGERAWLAGGEVTIAGTVGTELRAAGGKVVLEGTINGPAWVWAEELQIGPNARIAGDLHYTGPKEPRIAEGARIEGRVNYQESEESDAGGAIWAVILGFLGFFLLAIVYVLLFPRFSQTAADELRRDPWPSLGWGFLVLFVAPVAAVLMMVTLVGIPLGLLVLWLYPVVLLAGYLTALVFIAGWLARRAQKPLATRGALLLFVVAAMVAWVIVSMIPFLGMLAGFFLWVFGVGAFIRALFHRRMKNSGLAVGGGADI